MTRPGRDAATVTKGMYPVCDEFHVLFDTFLIDSSRYREEVNMTHDIATGLPTMSEGDEDYSTFSPDNMMKATDFQSMTDAEKAELDALLSVSV